LDNLFESRLSEDRRQVVDEILADRRDAMPVGQKSLERDAREVQIFRSAPDKEHGDREQVIDEAVEREAAVERDRRDAGPVRIGRQPGGHPLALEAGKATFFE